ncbi:uncharacterized protein LOC115969235 [Quercus lobata]|uniref:uncharacterized protein LOC115969235 n=1 Tax=Quercus lobata TaxID=97700 RepID=UPI001246D5E9|nr:uncharacterized protein LOC115969235 [Quercus lobata]
MKHGDRNMKFFHSKATQRRKKNRISGIQNAHGQWVEELEEVVEVAADYFDNLFSAGAADQMEECLNAIPNKVTDNMQEVLLGEFTAEEIKVALFQMGPTKASRPNEGFTTLLAKVELEGRITGVSICRGAPRVTNLLFADDSLLFFQATPKEREVVAKILQNYERASSQSINPEKSLAFFNNNTTDIQKQQIFQILGVKEVVKFESYLGLPTLIGRDKYHTFAYLKDRV